MRLPLSSIPFVLLSLSTFQAYAHETSELLDKRQQSLAKREAANAAGAKETPAVSTSRPDVGTKDAPVDGLDGKPHAGPFVDSTIGADSTLNPIKNKNPSSKDKTGKPFDNGVMRDPNRVAPKEGSTGTEGGVSEKTKQEKENLPEKPKVPESPKDKSSVAHGEKQDDMTSDRRKNKNLDKEQTKLDPSTGESLSSSTSSKGGSGKSDSKDDRPKGAPGIDKPDDLPKRPHDATDPEALVGTQKDSKILSSVSKESSTSKTSSSLLQDDSDDEHEDDTDLHEIIPWDALIGSFSSIAATEIGDKTFIVAALMAMRHPRLQVFTAAFSALFVMTILSGITGHAVGAVLSKKWSAVVAAILFLGFGAKALKEGYDMSPDQGASEEIQEVQAELEEKEVDMARQGRRASAISPHALESGLSNGHARSKASRSPSNSSGRSYSPSKNPPTSSIAGIKNLLSLVLSPAWVETFSMTFVGELGDRSQIATVAMAAGQEYYWVMVGASLGHFACTACAVIGGSVLAGRVSMRKVTLIGGFIFVGFGLFTFVEARQYWS